MVNIAKNEPLFLFAALVIILFPLYYPALNGPFLFDDTSNIEQNRDLHIKDASLSCLKKAVHGPRPVAMLSFAINYYLHGLSPFWFRITNIFIHICTAMLLYFVLRHTVFLLPEDQDIQFYQKIPLISTLLWAVHPLHIQSVTYIVQRMNSLAGLFFLLSLLMYIHARLAISNSSRIFFIFFCVVTALLAIGSKPNASMLPVVIILYDWFFFQKKKLSLISINFSVPAIFSLVAVGTAAYYLMDRNPINSLASWYVKKGLTPVQQLITEFRVIIIYISLFLFPHPSRLNIDHDILLSASLISPPSTALSLAAIIGLLLTALLTVKKIPLFSFGIFWFFINLLVESTFIPLDFIFEHRTYIPSMMPTAGSVFLIIRVLQKKYVTLFTFAAIACLWSFWTYQRNGVWESGLSLWQDSANKSPNKSRPHESLAYYLEQAGRFSESLDHYRRAMQLGSNKETMYINIGNIYTKIGYLQYALDCYKAALSICPNYKEASNNAGNALHRLGKFNQAIVYYQKALEIDNTYTSAHVNIANALASTGEFQSAIHHYELADKLDPGNAAIKYNKGIMLMRMSHFAEAEQELEQLVAYKKDFKEAYNSLGIVREHLGKTKEALESYNKALAIDPNFSDSQKNIERLQKRKD